MLILACLAWAALVLAAARPKPPALVLPLPPLKPAGQPFDVRARELALWNGVQAREIERFVIEQEASACRGAWDE